MSALVDAFGAPARWPRRHPTPDRRRLLVAHIELAGHQRRTAHPWLAGLIGRKARELERALYPAGRP